MATEPRWYQFKDQERKEIVGSYANQQQEQPGQGPIEQLPESDTRVQEFLGPTWARSPYQNLIIESIEDLILAYRLCSMIPKFGFRGQPDYDWPLSTPIERNRDEVLLREIGLEQFEQRILMEAKRRGHYYLSDRPDENDTMGWLALLRHFGVPTRLLDITWSIFVATYFAVEDKKSDIDASVWAFNQAQMNLNLHSIIMSNSKALFLQRPGGVFIDNYQPPTFGHSGEPIPERNQIRFEDVMMRTGGPDLNLLFNLALQGALSVEGLIFIEPQWLNKRMDIQQGAFLVPLRLQTGFMSNLFAIGKIHDQNAEERTVSSIFSHNRTVPTIQANASVIKFRVKSSLKNTLRAFLSAANIRKLVLFPDAEGFFGHLADLIPTGKLFTP